MTATWHPSAVRHITGRPLAETASGGGNHNHTEHKFRELADSLPQTVFEMDLEGNLTFVNRSGYGMWQATQEDVDKGINIFEWLLPECHASARADMQRALRGEGGGSEFLAKKKDGRVFPIVVHARPIVHEGVPVGLRGIVVDISSQKRTEAALARSESRFRSLVKNSVFGIYRSSLDGRFIEVNPALVTMLGYDSEAELQSIPVLVLYRDPRDRRILLERFRHATQVKGVEAEWRRKDGTPIVVRLNGRWVPDDGEHPEGFEMVVEDVSERRTLEQQLHQAQKMEAVGRLAGGIAHDFNNLLTAILGYTDMLRERLGADEESSRDVHEINRAAERASALTRQLLAFSRKQVLQPKPIDLHAVVTAIAPMLHRLIGEDVHLSIAGPGRMPVVKADPGQIEQVIMNLVVNARDAMPNGGTLTVETATVELDETYARQHGAVVPGRYVMLAVTDSGCGMNEEVKAHLFEPFFTTKERGKGTGLGLATVYGIVRQSGGHVFVYSEPRIGTTLKLYFPCIDEQAEEIRVLNRTAEHLPVGTETILLVEDDESVRSLARELLARQGYGVLEAECGDRALKVAQEHDGPIDLLVTDVVMPNMSGHDLSERFAALRPDARVLFVSGYADVAVVANGELREGLTFLQKPFARVDLLRTVRQTLDAPKSA
jgi:two-component system, cell cycle sensor histidine kinase and response regulator CckA